MVIVDPLGGVCCAEIRDEGVFISATREAGREADEFVEPVYCTE
jgi:hypothetical protein